MLEAMQERKSVWAAWIIPCPIRSSSWPRRTRSSTRHLPLPEAQLDRFIFMINVDYPTQAEELQIMKMATGLQTGQPEPVLTTEAFSTCNRSSAACRWLSTFMLTRKSWFA